MKFYIDISAMFEFDTDEAVVEPEFVESAIEEHCTISYEGLIEYLKTKAKVELIAVNINNKEVVSE